MLNIIAIESLSRHESVNVEDAEIKNKQFVVEVPICLYIDSVVKQNFFEFKNVTNKHAIKYASNLIFLKRVPPLILIVYHMYKKYIKYQ